MEQQKLEVDLRVGKVYSNKEDDYMHLTLEDCISGIRFGSIEMSLTDFGKFVTGTEVTVKGEFTGLKNIGKVREYEKVTLVIPTDTYRQIVEGRGYDEHNSALAAWLVVNHSREGWYVDTYLGSRGSVSGDFDKKTTIKYGYYRYVDKSKNQSDS